VLAVCDDLDGWRGLRALRYSWVAFANLLVARGGSFFACSRPALSFTSTLVLRMRCSRVRRFLSEYPTFDFQLSTFNLPARSFLVPIPARNPFKPLHLQLSLDRDRNHVVICSLILSHQSRRTAPQAAPFNRVFFLSPSSPHLCALCGENSLPFRSSLIPRHSPLATNSFIIRTYKHRSDLRETKDL